jgi:hypothetical protein
MYCKKCGTYLEADSRFCPQCGTPVEAAIHETTSHETETAYETQQETSTYHESEREPRRFEYAPYDERSGYYSEAVSDRNKTILLLLCLFAGVLGVHRFYAGKIGTGILYLLTWGLFGIGSLVDTITIICGGFTDGDGRTIVNW